MEFPADEARRNEEDDNEVATNYITWNGSYDEQNVEKDGIEDHTSNDTPGECYNKEREVPTGDEDNKDCPNPKERKRCAGHYRFRGSSGKILKSYLERRQQYVEIQSKESEVKDCIDASVIQGSKLSGLLYNLYCNEVPLVHLLLKNDEEVGLPKELKNDDRAVSHIVHNFVNDLSSLICSKD